MTTSGRPAYGNLAGHPFGVNAKWLQQTNNIFYIFFLHHLIGWDIEYIVEVIHSKVIDAGLQTVKSLCV